MPNLYRKFSISIIAASFLVAILFSRISDSQAVSLVRSTVSSDNVKLLFFGDVMVARGNDKHARTEGVKYFLDGLAGKDKKFFQGYDLISANMEGAVLKNGEHRAPVKDYDFSFRPEVIAQFKNYGFNYFTIANNHILDQGASGYKETRENLTKLGLDFSGCPDRKVGECSVSYVVKNGQKLAMIGFAQVGGALDKSYVEVIKKARTQADFVIVNIHWGVEYQKHSNAAQQKMAHSLIDNGADVVIGHHPHVIQESEVYKGKPIFYSLGNYIFDQTFSRDTQRGLAVEVELSADKISTKTLSFRSDKSKLTWVK